MKKGLLGAAVALAAIAGMAGEWKGLEEANWLSGRKVKPLELRRKIVAVVDWGKSAEGSAETIGFIQKNVGGHRANGHPVDMVASHREGGEVEAIKAAIAAGGIKCPVYQGAEYSEAPGGKLPYIYVVDTTGAVVYGGGDKNAAVVALVEAISGLPEPGQLVNGVALKKFKRQAQRMMMGVRAEGATLAPFKAGLKSKKPGEAEEAQAILDAIEKSKANLEASIKDALEAGDKGMALRDITWFVKTWPSEAEKYREDHKRLAADPEARAGAAALMKAMKKKRK